VDQALVDIGRRVGQLKVGEKPLRQISPEQRAIHEQHQREVMEREKKFDEWKKQQELLKQQQRDGTR
jgi:hypothetical protein